MYATIPDPELIDTNEKLKKLATVLETQPRLAVDTEANSLHAYQERVCLIQFSSASDDYLVDPLSIDDMTWLGPIFADPKIEKVFHAVEYDLIGLQRDFAYTFSNIFDTMVAARTLGYKQVGLASLLNLKLEIEVDKRHQKADWGQRPLLPSMVSYAGIDTHYLLELRDVLAAELQEKGLYDLAQEDFARSCFVAAANNGPQRAAWERVDGRKDLDQRQQTILHELCQCRDSIAKKMDRPVFKVLDDKVLLALAQSEAAGLDELLENGLMSERQFQRFGRTLWDALQRGRRAHLVTPTVLDRVPDSQMKRLQKLKQWRKDKAKELEVESDVVLPKVHMHSISEVRAINPEKLASLMHDSPYRLARWGDEILAALK